MATMTRRSWRKTFLLGWLLALALILATASVALAVAPASAAPTQTAAKCKTVVVKKDDTLSAIAARYGMTVKALAKANSIGNVNNIRVGQKLCIPGAVQTATKPAAKPAKPPTAAAVWSDPGVAIEVFSPVAGGAYHSPIELIGFSKTFEGNVNIRLSDAASGELLGERQVTGGGGEHKFFRSYIRFETFSEGSQAAVLEFFEIEPVSGAEVNKTTLNVTLLPGQRVIDVWYPKVGEVICRPFDVVGYSWTFEATVPLELQDRAGFVMDESFGMGGGTMYDVFAGELSAGIDAPIPALASAFEASARDGSHIDETRIPIAIIPKCKLPKRPGNG